jgi:hypothetical protein
MQELNRRSCAISALQHDFETEIADAFIDCERREIQAAPGEAQLRLWQEEGIHSNREGAS